MIRRRHVFYLEGYDPQGAEGYYGIFQRSFRRFLNVWSLNATLGPLQIDSEYFAHWDIETVAPNWQVQTRYEFVRQEQIVRTNMVEPIWRLIGRALFWNADYLFSGTMYRIYKASWRFWLAILGFQYLLVAWLLLSVLGGAIVFGLLANYLSVPLVVSAAIGAVATVGVFLMLRPLADRLFVVQINSHWPHLCEFVRGEASCFNTSIEACAERVVAVARANATDEILVIGHSGGGVTAPAALARALELDPDVGRHGPRVVLLTLGSIMPAAGLYPDAVKLRDVIERIAVEPSVQWIDVQSSKDVFNFENFDPVGGIGIDVKSQRRNPLVWRIRFRDMLTEKFYAGLHTNFFRLHFQFITANDMRAAYDYFMLTCGPFTPADWANRGRALTAEFSDQGAHVPSAMPATSVQQSSGG